LLYQAGVFYVKICETNIVSIHLS